MKCLYDGFQRADKSDPRKDKAKFVTSTQPNNTDVDVGWKWNESRIKENDIAAFYHHVMCATAS
jgi:hypothetical protein